MSSSRRFLEANRGQLEAVLRIAAFALALLLALLFFELMRFVAGLFG
jgi:hypothetical protein